MCPAGREIELIPDSVFSVPDIIERGTHSDAFRSTTERWGLKRPYLIVQPSDALWRHKDVIAGYLRAAAAKGWDVLELPIGFEIGNYTGFYKEGVTVRAGEWPEPLLLAEIIANAEAAIGISLHLSVVASCFGIPVYRPPYARSSKFVVLEGLPNISFFGDGAPLLGRDELSADLHQVSEYRAKLDVHWQRLAQLAGPAAIADAARVRGAWTQLCMTPDAFRRTGGFRSRIQAKSLELRRRRHFVMHDVRKLRRLGNRDR
jgi:lipopolysaccharide transport system ATP-binding protein